MAKLPSSFVDTAQKHLGIVITIATIIGLAVGGLSAAAAWGAAWNKSQTRQEQLEKQVTELSNARSENPIAARCVEMSRLQTDALTSGRFTDAGNIKDAMDGLRCQDVEAMKR